MTIHVVGSGSDGNCYLVEHDGKFLALDAGCKWFDVQLASGFRTADIQACLVDHRHFDHCRYIKDFLKFGIPVYSNDRTAADLLEITGEHVRCLRYGVKTRISGGYIVVPFPVPHEDVENSAFLIEFPNGERLLYATDFEYIRYNLASWKINHFLIAVNHTEEIPEDAHAREHRYRGHSSLDTVKDFLKTSMTDACKSVTACHLSGEFADADKILTELKDLCGDRVQVDVADKGKIINL